MPRPNKRRRICAEPACRRFGPIGYQQGENASVTMTVDEFETIRLIDLEGMTQEQCAAQMDVARTTVQAIYSSARLKLARCLVNRLELRVDGGDYVLCDGSSSGCARFCRHRPQTTGKMPVPTEPDGRIGTMKIAVTYENGQIFQHFGHTEQFKVYEVENGAVASSQVVNTNGSGHGALAGLLKALGVDTLICGGIGGGAQAALSEAGIRLYGGVSGDADRAVEALLSGNLMFQPDVMCNHHGEHHGSCGEHGCGEHQEQHHCGGHCHG